jgi:hypothetical protein
MQKALPLIDETHSIGLQAGDDAFRARLRTVISEAPTTGLADDELRALTRLQTMLEFSTNWYTVGSSFTQRLAAIDAELVAIVDRATITPVKDEAITFLKYLAENILNDVVCELAWKYMQTDEQSLISDLVASGNYMGVVEDMVDDVANMTLDAAVSAIEDVAISAYSRQYADPEVINWATYAFDVYQKAEELLKDSDRQLTHSDGGYVTYARVQFAYACLATTGS